MLLVFFLSHLSLELFSLLLFLTFSCVCVFVHFMCAFVHLSLSPYFSSDENLIFSVCVVFFFIIVVISPTVESALLFHNSEPSAKMPFPSLLLPHSHVFVLLGLSSAFISLQVKFPPLLFLAPLPPPSQLSFFQNVTKSPAQFISLFLYSPYMKLMIYEMHFVLWDFDTNLRECHVQ